MEEFGEHNAGSSQTWELSNGQDQQWCSPDSFEGMPYQPDFHSQIQPPFYSQLQPNSYSISHSSPFQDHFQNPYPNNQPYLPENSPNFFQSQDSFQSFQCPAYGDSFSQFQNQEQPFYSQPPAFTEFQQEGQQYYEPQPLLLLEELIATFLEALKPNPEWFIQREKEEREFLAVMEAAGFHWRNSESGMKNNKEEEEEKACDLMDKAQEWQMEVEESGYVGVDLHLNAPGLLQQEEEKEGQDNELKEEEEEEKMMDNSYPLFKIGDQLFASSTCQGFLSLQPVQDQHVEGGVEQSKEELDIPSPSAQNRKLQQEREEVGKKMETDAHLYPMFRRGGEIFAYSPCEVELFLRTVKDKYGEGDGVEQDKAELESPCLQSEVDQEAQQKEAEEKRIAATMKSLVEQDIPFPAALKRTKQQREEEAKKKKLEEEKLLSLLLIRKKEEEKEKTLEDDDYFSLLFGEEEANACGAHHKRRQKKRRKKRRKKKKKLEGVQHTLLEVKEITIIEKVISALDFLLQEMRSLSQHNLSFKKEGEKEESLQISPSSPNLHQLKDKEFTSTHSDFLLQEAYSITTVQTNEEKLEEDEHLSLLLRKEEEAISDIAWGFHLQSELRYQERQQQQKKRKRKLVENDLSLLLRVEPYLHLQGELELLLLQSAQQQEVEEKKIATAMQYVAELELPLPAAQKKKIHQKEEEEQGKKLQVFNDLTLLEGEEANAITSGQHPFKEEKKQEDEQKRAMAPSLQEHEASELHLPQATTPRHKEAAVYPLMSNNFSFEIELTPNEFSFSFSMFISGDKLQTQQLPLLICKLHFNVLLGEVHKKGTKGDGVPWFIKVHPP